jgi:dihydroorotate dehydrogenase
MYARLRPLLFRLDPERAHSLTLAIMRLAGQLAPVRVWLRSCFAVPEKQVQAFGLTFKNPIGLAAGYDKDGLAWRGLACLGFGHIEIGTVTPDAQRGNPPPRLFRLPEDRALINRLGFPNRGADFVRKQLNRRRRPPGLILGVNLGKNRDTPLEEAAGDYLCLMECFASLADYLVINVSSPNTVGLRRLQARQALEALLGVLSRRREQLPGVSERNIPLLVKLAPDLEPAELDDALEAILNTGMDGVIATNTTLERGKLRSPRALEAGGLSGATLAERSTQVIKQIERYTGGRLPIIGVGGVMGPADARQKLDAGASLVQVYTGLIYEGPGLVKRIVAGI